MLAPIRARAIAAARSFARASAPVGRSARLLTTAVPEDKDKKEEKKGFLSTFTSDWKYFVPAGILVAIPALANEVIVLSEEAQLLAVFMLFTGTIYTQAGGMISSALDEYRENILKEQRAIEDAQIEQIRNSIEEHEKCLTLAQDYDQFLAVKDAARRLNIEASNYEAKHAFRSAVVRKLEAVAATEEAALQGIKGRMVNYVVDDVTTRFRSDKAAKEAALEQALAVLGNSKGKIGKDVVGDAFVNSIRKYREEYKKTPEDKDPILLQLKKDVEAIVKA